MPPMAAPMMPPPTAQSPEPGAPAEPASPREAADQLFNEAMMAGEANDQATLARVLPGALAAYRALGPLDGDGTYHLAALELVGGKYAEARATCATLLATNPNHVLALGVSLRAAQRAGDAAATLDFAQRLLKAYDAEAQRPLPEYQDHQRMLPNYRAEAMAALK
jgi:Tfp pilus assembly protein PilF